MLARRLLRTLLFVALAVAIAGCATDTTQRPSIRVVNKTGQPIHLTYEEPGHPMDLGTIDPERASTIGSVFAELGPSCHGPFVARDSDGREIARLARACAGQDWSVARPGPSTGPTGT